MFAFNAQLLKQMSRPEIDVSTTLHEQQYILLPCAKSFLLCFWNESAVVIAVILLPGEKMTLEMTGLPWKLCIAYSTTLMQRQLLLPKRICVRQFECAQKDYCTHSGFTVALLLQRGSSM